MNVRLILLQLILVFGANAQLVNIESQRMQSDSVRATGNAEAGYSYQKTNDIVTSKFNASLAVQLKSKSLRQIYLILGDYDLARSFDQTSNHAGFGHFRYNYKVNSWLRWEAYSQLQFNELLSLKTRLLLGTGARFKVLKEEHLKSYIGVSSFFEYEEVRDPGPIFNRDFRLSTYAVLSWKFPKNRGELTSTTYYQPLLNNFTDYRINSQNALVLNITKHVAFTTQFSYFVDSRPPINVDREVFSLENGIRVTL